MNQLPQAVLQHTQELTLDDLASLIMIGWAEPVGVQSGGTITFSFTQKGLQALNAQKQKEANDEPPSAMMR